MKKLRENEGGFKQKKKGIKFSAILDFFHAMMIMIEKLR